MIIYNSSFNIDSRNLSDKNPNKLKTTRIPNKKPKVKPSAARGRKNLKVTRKNALYLKSIGLKLRK